jgi:hypothetical protein
VTARTNRTLGRRLAAVVAVAIVAGACGETYVEPGATAATDPSAATTSPPPTTSPDVDPDTPIDELLGEIEVLMLDLDQRIIDGNGQVATLERIDALWAAADRRIRADDPSDLFNFEQAIELARTGVERRRPADASKGYKIFVDVADAYLADA